MRLQNTCTHKAIDGQWTTKVGDGLWLCRNFFLRDWSALRKRSARYARTEADGRRLRAKEATKVYPVGEKKCQPHRARPFGTGLECQHGWRSFPTADASLPLLWGGGSGQAEIFSSRYKKSAIYCAQVRARSHGMRSGMLFSHHTVRCFAMLACSALLCLRIGQDAGLARGDSNIYSLVSMILK